MALMKDFGIALAGLFILIMVLAFFDDDGRC